MVYAPIVRPYQLAREKRTGAALDAGLVCIANKASSHYGCKVKPRIRSLLPKGLFTMIAISKRANVNARLEGF